jgi:cbb3-type cytochrome oxidase cytochrome c subunit
MNQGPLIFLGVFGALAFSWFGLIVQPQLQIGRALPETNVFDRAELYPQPRSGLAQRGLQVYRSLGCATCHSQQVGQTGAVFDVVLASAGTNVAATVQALLQVKRGLTPAEAGKLAETTPVLLFEGVNKAAADVAVGGLSASGARVELKLVAQGPDIARGWGRARSVAVDYLYDYPVLLGTQRIGPDLANTGLRLPSAAWHLLHLYHPRTTVPGSVMPPHPFLFEQRPRGAAPAPEALKLPAPYAPGGGVDVVPTDEARALVAYLLSLRADVAIFERPMAAASPPPAAAAQGVPGPGGATNTLAP